MLKENQYPRGDSETAQLIRSVDWEKNRLGPQSTWPQTLWTSLDICLNSRFPMFILWGKNLTMFYNDAYAPLAGILHPEALGKSARDMFSGTWSVLEPMINSVYETGKATWSEDQMIVSTRNGFNEECYFTHSYSPIHSVDDSIIGIFCAVTETTEKVQSLNRLRESETNFRNLIIQAPLGICLVSGEPLIVEVLNDAFLKLFGKGPQDFENKLYWDVLPETRDTDEPILKKVLSTGDAFHGREHKVTLLRNGKDETIYVDFVYEPIREVDGAIKRMMVIAIDVTDKVLSRKKIEASESDFRQLADSLPQLVWTTDKDGNQIFVSKRWEEYSGIGPSGPDTWTKMVHPKDLALITKTFSDSLATGKPYRGEVRLKSKENNYEWHYVLGEPIRNDRGEIEKWTGAFTNFNEQKLAEESLMLQAQVLENIDEGVSVSDENGYILFTNSAEDAMFGYEHGGLIGKHVSVQNAYDTEENIRKVKMVIEEVLSKGVWNGEWHKIKKDGTTFFTQSHISSLELGDRNLIVCVQRNVTEEKAYKEQLKRFKFMADNATDPFILMKEDGSFAYLNDLALERWGYTRDEASNLFVPDVDSVFNAEEFTKIFAKAQSEKIEQFETIHVRKDGTQYPVEISMGGLILDGRPYLFAVARDITETKRVREELSLSLSRFKHMSDTMAQFVWTADAEGKLNYFNEAVFNYSGLNFEKLQKDGWLQIIHKDDHEENISKWINSLTTGEHFILHHRFLRHDGEYRWQLSRAIPQYGSDGAIELWVGTSTDIHDQKLFEEKLAREVADRTQQLNEANIELQKSNAELEQFAYIASHDLQEPLRKIRTFASMLKEGNKDFSEKENNYLSKIMASSERMTNLINDILNFSKLAQTDIAYVPVNLNDILQSVVEDLEMEIELKNVTIEKDQLPVIEAIPIQMNQLFFNLMSNSLKFAKVDDPLVIRIKKRILSAEDTAAQKNLNNSLNYIEINFIDNGIGFDQQYGEKIFNIFQRLNNRSYAGSGIGLALCRRIVHSHHGEIFALSNENEGATFKIFLPLKHNRDGS